MSSLTYHKLALKCVVHMNKSTKLCSSIFDHFWSSCPWQTLQLPYFITARKRSLAQDNVFTPVRHSVHKEGGGGRVCLAGGHASWEDVCGGGGRRGRKCRLASGRYASYWNAVLVSKGIHIITNRMCSMGKVMFSQVSVWPQGGASWMPSLPCCSMDAHPPSHRQEGDSQQAVGTHPTGMHSCYLLLCFGPGNCANLTLDFFFKKKLNFISGERPYKCSLCPKTLLREILCPNTNMRTVMNVTTSVANAARCLNEYRMFGNTSSHTVRTDPSSVTSVKKGSKLQCVSFNIYFCFRCVFIIFFLFYEHNFQVNLRLSFLRGLQNRGFRW